MNRHLQFLGDLFMQKIDDQLFRKTRGKHTSLEQAIETLHNDTNNSTNIFGSLIPLESFLLTKEAASQLIYSTAKKHWGQVDLFIMDILKEYSIDIENASIRLHNFFESDKSIKIIMDFLHIHHSFHFGNLLSIVFGKENIPLTPISGLRQFYLFKVGNKYFLQIMYNHYIPFWDMMLAKKIYSLFIQVPLHEIQNPIELIKLFHEKIKNLYSLNQSVAITNKLIQFLDFENPRSFWLKEFHIFNVIIHFQGGRRHQKKLNKLVSHIYESWGQGKWELTEKERTLLAYIMTVDCFQNEEIEKTIEYGHYLITHDRLTNHAIELLLDYSNVLPNMKPEPASLVKRYDQNYLEQIFYILIHALVETKKYEQVMHLLKEHEMASCSSIYDYLNNEQNKDLLFKIEATVQVDIAFIIDNSPQHIMQSIEKWRNVYQQEDSKYYPIACMTSTHICNILKACFATKHFDLFDRLMEIYKKYLVIDSHFENLREFIKEFL